MEIREEKKLEVAEANGNEQTSSRFKESRNKKAVSLSESKAIGESINSDKVRSYWETKGYSSKKSCYENEKCLNGNWSKG